MNELFRQSPNPLPVWQIDQWQYHRGETDQATIFDSDGGWRDGGRTLIWDDDTTVVWFRTTYTVPTEARGRTLVLAIDVRSAPTVYVDGELVQPSHLLTTSAEPGTEYRIAIRADRGRRPGLIMRAEVTAYPAGYERWFAAKQKLASLATLRGITVDNWRISEERDGESLAAPEIDHSDWPERKLGVESRKAGVWWYRDRIAIPEDICGYPTAGKKIRLTAGFNGTGSVWVDGEKRSEYARDFDDSILTENAESGVEYTVAIRVPSDWNAWLRDTRILVQEHADALDAQKRLNAEVDLWNRFLDVRPDERFVEQVLHAVNPALAATPDTPDVGPAIEAALANLTALRNQLAAEAPFIAFPYLQLPTTDSIVVRAESLFPRVSEFRVTLTTGDVCRMRDAEPTRFHRHLVEGLEPDTRYEYFVRAGNVEIGPFEFTTAPADTVADGRELRIAAWGDSHYGPTILERIIERVDEYQPDLILTAGDMIGDGINEYEWIDHFFEAIRMISPRVPVHFPVGNHDHGSWRHYDNQHDGNPYLDARFEPQQPISDGAPVYVPGENPYAYSFTYAGVHAVFIDPLHLDRETGYGLTKGSAQWEWLKRDLEASRDARWTLLFVHEPIFCETWENGYYDGEEVLRTDVVPLLEEYGVDLCISGHAHTYERGIPHPPYDPETGEGNTVSYLITGGGGAQMDNRKYREWPQIDIPPHRVEPTDDIRLNDSGEYYRYHFCTLTITDTKLECIAHWVRTDGTIVDELDRFVLRKRIPSRGNPEHID